MPFIPSEHVDKVRQKTITIDDDTFSVWYRPHVITPASMDDARLAANEEDADRLTEMVTHWVTQWEIGDYRTNGHLDESGKPAIVRDDNGQPIIDMWPVDAAHAKQLGYLVLNTIVLSVIEDMTPGEAKSTASKRR